VTKKEIVRRISERAELTQLKTKEIVQWTFDAIIDTLITDGRIELRNFGVFEVRRRKARRARNPRTNDRVDVPEKNVVTFQPGKEMEERVRREAKVYEPKRKKSKGVPGANASANAAKSKPAPAANKVKAAPKKAKGSPAPAPQAGGQPVGAPPAPQEQELAGVGAPADNTEPAEATA
jgi:nucleoid DNA-binding protein